MTELVTTHTTMKLQNETPLPGLNFPAPVMMAFKQMVEAMTAGKAEDVEAEIRQW